MVKRCIICGKEAEFCIKNSSEYYCEDCAAEQFSDLSYLQRVEDQAKRLKSYLKTKVGPRYDEEEYEKE